MNDGNLQIRDGHNPVLQAQMEAEGAIVLILYIPVMGMYMDFTFRFLPVALDTAFIVETQLRDAEEEIERLKGEITRLKHTHNNCIVLRSENGGSYPPQPIISWNILIQNSSPHNFQVFPEYQQLKILSDGLYQISCRYLVSGDGRITASLFGENQPKDCCQCLLSGFQWDQHVKYL
jgi:hypothetical protein